MSSNAQRVHEVTLPTIYSSAQDQTTQSHPGVQALKDKFEKIAANHQSAQAVLNHHQIPAGPRPARIVKITGADNGKTIAVREGGSFSISLRENPSTGYVWSVVPGSRALGMPSSKFVSDAHQPGMTGVGGVRSFTWKTSPMIGANSGTVIPVELTHKRPWEAGTGDLFHVNIKII